MKKCTYIATYQSAPCPNDATTRFFDEWSGYRADDICEEHFQFLRERALREREAMGWEEESPIIFDEELAAAVEGREY